MCAPFSVPILTMSRKSRTPTLQHSPDNKQRHSSTESLNPFDDVRTSSSSSSVVVCLFVHCDIVAMVAGRVIQSTFTAHNYKTRDIWVVRWSVPKTFLPTRFQMYVEQRIYASTLCLTSSYRIIYMCVLCYYMVCTLSDWHTQHIYKHTHTYTGRLECVSFVSVSFVTKTREQRKSTTCARHVSSGRVHAIIKWPI